METEFALIGFEYNDLWKKPDLYSRENEHGIMITANEWEDVATFETHEHAESKREYLQVNYPDYTWYVIALKL